MAKSSLPTTPQAPGFLGFLSGGVLRVIVVVTTLLVLLVLFGFVISGLRRIGLPTADPTATSAPPPAPEPANPYAVLHKLQRLRCELLEIDQQSQRVWDEIDLLEEDALAWRESFEKLLVSETGKKLKHDQWVVEYAWLHQEDSHRKFRAADDFRQAVNMRMKAIRLALDDPKGKLTVTTEDKRAFADIGQRVATARDAYNAHRKLLDALVGTTESGDKYTPGNLQEAVELFGWKRILADFGHPDYVGQGSADIPVGQPSRPDQPSPSTSDSIRELKEAFEREMNQRPDGGEIGRSMRLRDELPEPDGGMGEYGPRD